MGKGKKRKAPTPRDKGPREEPPNLFERLSNKKRFNILGRKLKGETRELGKLRSEATERRKDTLLVEYKQLRKSNAFLDRRFGEDDESLTADEKALLRFQKQRLKEMAGSKFSLPDNDGGEGDGGEQLTHMGRSLAEMEDVQEVREGCSTITAGTFCGCSVQQHLMDRGLQHGSLACWLRWRMFKR